MSGLLNRLASQALNTNSARASELIHKAFFEPILTIWNDCLSAHGGPFLFGERSMADAMYAPVVTRFRTYDVGLDRQCAAYCEHIMALPEMVEWIEAARREPEEIEEFEAEF